MAAIAAAATGNNAPLLASAFAPSLAAPFQIQRLYAGISGKRSARTTAQAKRNARKYRNRLRAKGHHRAAVR